MRIGIDYRILTVGPSAATRGMPRYTQQQLREVLASGTDDEFLLFCDPRTDQSLILPEIRRSPNVGVRWLPEAVTVDSHRDDTLLAKAEVFEAWLASQQVDVYHATTPFYLDQLIVAHHDACPYVATVYDLIPLIYPAQYLATPKLRQLYLLAGAMVSRATRLLAISEAARRDAARYLGVAEDRIDVASPIAEAFFRPMDEREVGLQLAGLRARVGLRGSFILSVADLHFTKNLETLLRGYARLPAAIRAELPLVVACHLSQAHATYLGTLAAKLGVGGQVLPTGLVSDHELAALYNAARLLVHPSRFEGFGLPVLEAMQCGTPVIAATSSSLPEVAGEAALLVDPDDAPAFTAAMQELVEDPVRRSELRERGLVRSKAFSGRALAEATRSSYERAVDQPEAHDRLRVAVWTPLPPLATGIADYAEHLVVGLSPHCDVELFVDDGYLPSLDILLAHGVRHFSAFDRLATRYDAIVYQIGASVFHLYMDEAMRRYPGVVVLHDLVWSHLVHHQYAEQEDIDGFRRRLAELEGADAVSEYDALDRSDHRRWAGILKGFLDRYLMLGEIVSSSRALIVHYPAGADELDRRYPGADATFVPMGVPDVPGAHVGSRSSGPRARARARLGVDPSTFIVGVFGAVDEVKRVEASITALREVVQVRPDTLLIIIGPVLDLDYQRRLVALARRNGVVDAVRITGRVDRAVFDDYLLVADVAVNLRFPSRKQMSATVVRAAAAGVPVIISNLSEWDFLPATFCRRVPADDDGVALAGHLVELALRPDLLAAESAEAKAFHAREATVARMAASYMDVLATSLDRRAEVNSDSPGSHRAPPVQRSTPTVNLNKVCQIEDFSDPEVAAVIRDVFSYKLGHMPSGYPSGSEYRKDWEIAMAVRALRAGGALRADAVVLGVGAGTEDTNFYLTRFVARVVATDRYLAPGPWGAVAPSAMIEDAASVAPYPFDESRLVVKHMDGRSLAFDDDTFDGIYSSGSIEHFGELEDVAAAAYEMGRVLKPGGVLSLSTELLLSGPPGGKGMPGTLLFSPADLRRYIIDASGLEPVDDLSLTVSQATLASQRDLAHAIRVREERIGGDHSGSWRGDPGLELPHLIVVSDGYVFCSIHLALRKGDGYPATPNAWARPSAALLRAIDDDNRMLVMSGGPDELGEASPSPSPNQSHAVAPPGPVPAPPALSQTWPAMAAATKRLAEDARTRLDHVNARTAQITEFHSHVDDIVAALHAEEELAAASAALIDRVLVEVSTQLRVIDDASGDEPGARDSEARAAVHGAGWRWCPVVSPSGAEFGVMVDPETEDDTAAALLSGLNPTDRPGLVLLSDLVRPGDLVVDVGVGAGLATLVAAAGGCRVVAVDPSPAKATLLRASVARNGFADVLVVNDDGRSAIGIDALLAEAGNGGVAMVRIGADVPAVAALEGMAELLAGDTAPFVQLEVASTGSGSADPVEHLAQLGFRVLTVDSGSPEPSWPGSGGPPPVVDYLAFKGSPVSLGPWRIDNQRATDGRSSNMVREPEGQ